MEQMGSKIVRTQYGEVRGIPADTEGIMLFKGIPVGQDTAGANRFLAPKPVAAHEGVLECDAWPDRFLQTEHQPEGFWYREFYSDAAYTPGRSENGLAVNVYAPKEAEEGNLPVFVYIHGGGMVGGYASEEEFNASHLAAQGVIVVLVQYRLGAMGWMALPELSKESPQGVSGNQAVLDLILQLQWIRDNISAFGGDPGKVTIAGQSAGAGMVTNLLRSPLAKGLFRNAIVQSGFDGFLQTAGGMSHFLTREEAESQNEKALEEIFGKKMTLSMLRSIPTQDFLQPSPSGRKNWAGEPMTLLEELNMATGRQVLDGYVFTEESIDLLRPGNLDGIQIMIGGCADEATSLVGDGIFQMKVMPEEAQKKLDEEYGAGCGMLYAVNTPEEARNAVLRAVSDQSLQKYLLSVRMTEDNRDHKSYAYYFRHMPPGKDREVFGAYHSAELWYMFDSIREKESQKEWTQADYQMARVMSRYWMNFVKYGNPNGDGLTEWLPCEKENGYSFAILEDGAMHMGTCTGNEQRDAHHRTFLENLL